VSLPIFPGYSRVVKKGGLPRLRAQGWSTINNIHQRSDDRRGAESENRTMRTGTKPKVKQGGLPENYPIFHPFLLGEGEQSAQSGPLFSHTLGSLGLSLCLISLIIPGLEPRALSTADVQRCTIDQHSTEGGWVYPGCVGRCIYPGR